MSPEQLRSTRHVDARADIWSMGTILFALVTGGPPYSGESTADIAAKIIRDPPPPLRALRPDAPEGLEAVITCCLEKDPEARYAGIAELAEALLPFAPVGSRAAAERLARQISSAPARYGADDSLLATRRPSGEQSKARRGTERTARRRGRPARGARRRSKRWSPSGAGRSSRRSPWAGRRSWGRPWRSLLPRGEMHGIPAEGGAHAARGARDDVARDAPHPSDHCAPCEQWYRSGARGERRERRVRRCRRPASRRALVRRRRPRPQAVSDRGARVIRRRRPKDPLLRPRLRSRRRARASSTTASKLHACAARPRPF